MRNSNKYKAVSFKNSYKDSSDDEKPPSKKNFHQYYGKCNHSTDKCTTFNALIKMVKSNTSKGYKKGSNKKYTKH